VCTPECSSDGDCAAGQRCKALSVCVPRAGACVGDGSFCSPCRTGRQWAARRLRPISASGS
jgi:hypothetical protein